MQTPPTPRWRRKWQPTPVFLPGESYGQRSLAGYSPWGRKNRTQLNLLTTYPSQASSRRSAARIGRDRGGGRAPSVRVSDWGRPARPRPSAAGAIGSKHGGHRGCSYGPRFGGVQVGAAARGVRGWNAGVGTVVCKRSRGLGVGVCLGQDSLRLGPRPLARESLGRRAERL